MLMGTDQIPDLSAVESPPFRGDIEYYDLEIGKEPLGEGGQTVVFEARVPGAESPQKVAVRQLGDREFAKSIEKEEIALFFNQAETWASLSRRERVEPRWSNSNHIVGVVTIGDNLPWMALEYMNGGSLANRLNDADGLPVKEAVWVTERLCRGLELAHNSGVAHLDLKPENILFQQTGQKTWAVPKIADWGLARELLDETSDSMDVLSIKYAAPEQFDREEFGRPGTATDIYQMGAVAYALLTGEPPYKGNERSIIFDIVGEEPPPPPSQRRDEISGKLDAVVQTALEPRQSNRFGSIETFRRALQAIRLDSRLPPVVTERSDSTETSSSARGNTGGKDSIDSHGIKNWPMFQGGSKRTGYRSTSAHKRSVTAQWRFQTGDSVTSSPAVVDGTVYIGSADNHVYALDAGDGSEQWRFQTGGSVTSSPAVIDGTVYVGSTDNYVYALDAGNGSEQWRFQTDGIVHSSPAVADGAAFFGSADSKLYALDAYTGIKKWDYDTSSPDGYPVMHGIYSSPVINKESVYVTSSAGGLYRINRQTGKETWSFGTNLTIGSSPAMSGEKIYFGSEENTLYSVDLKSENELWDFEVMGRGGISPRIWDGFHMESSPAVADSTVYTGHVDNNLYAVDTAYGTKQWHFKTDGGIHSSPAVANGNVYFGSNDEVLYAIDAATGRKQWQFNTSGKVQSSPAVVDETVYIGSNDNYVYALSDTNSN
jgi:outer membrane protein assembly factor BamB